MHVLSTYWMMTVGEKLDARLSDNVLGYRLRRTQGERFNVLGSGSFPPYMTRYRKWRDGPLDAARDALQAGADVAVLTGDATRFFHSLDPNFLTESGYIEQLGLDLNTHESHINQLFVRSLGGWMNSQAISSSLRARGLPVGLPASAVVANLALVELDRIVEHEVMPLKYARYVDDIAIVLHDNPRFTNATEVWRWISERSEGTITPPTVNSDQDQGSKQHPRNDDSSATIFTPPFMPSTRVEFGNKKNSLLRLEGTRGTDKLNALAARISEASSEWRLLSTVPEKLDEVGAEVARAVQPSAEHGGTLRDADLVTLTRSRFAICLSDYEAYAQDLPPTAWSAQRKRFLRAVQDHLLIPSVFFELGNAAGRVVRLGVSCGDFEEVASLIKGIASMVADAKDHYAVDVAGTSKVTSDKEATDQTRIWDEWRRDLAEQLKASVLVALPLDRQTTWEPDQVSDALSSLNPDHEWVGDENELLLQVHSINARDLGYRPLRRYFLQSDLLGTSSTSPLPRLGKGTAYPAEILAGAEAVCELLEIPAGLQAGVAFATRPVRLDELYLAQRKKDLYPDSELLVQAMIGARGYEPGDSLASVAHESTTQSESPKLKHQVLKIKGGRASSRSREVHVALGVTQSETDTWKGAALGAPELTLAKRNRLARLVNDVLRTSDALDYFVLHELAIPPAWFMRIALKLRAHGIGLVSGVEYITREPRLVANQVWAALPVHHPDVPSMYIHKQDKQLPAPHEEELLTELGDLRFEPISPRTNSEQIPVIDHGGFYFSVLICHELTDISARAYLRGKVDALFVPEHNQDIKSFSSLVESSALDIHAYIVQANDRRFGDSRVRAPRKKDYQRDLVRVSRGTRDYVVAATLDIDALRIHQSMYRPDPNITGFKPCPSGFEITPARKKSPPVKTAGQQALARQRSKENH
ncbi:reverse transcriptase domain-containing protein [Demequina sp. SO4-18]|uniref:reverse transcriptase domain-containing protein n=1 Tax=Demequina sp. SO4-18 TaxID=3401026 RepID=UPI003B5C44BD